MGRRYIELVARINALRPATAGLTDQQLAGKTAELRQRLQAFEAEQQGGAGGDAAGWQREPPPQQQQQQRRRGGGAALLGGMPEGIVVEAFAVVREAAQRVLGLRHYDVQLVRCPPPRAVPPCHHARPHACWAAADAVSHAVLEVGNPGCGCI